MVMLSTHKCVCKHQSIHFEQIKCYKKAKHSTMSVSKLSTMGSFFRVTAFPSASFPFYKMDIVKMMCSKGAKKGIAIGGWCLLEKLPPHHAITHKHKY